MRFKVDHDYHIHSEISICSDDPKQTTERILQYAKDNGLSRIVLTDHYWDASIPCDLDFYQEQDFDRIKKSLPLPKAEGIEFLFGCETEMRMDYTIGIPENMYDTFDFIIIPTTHMHIDGFVIRKEDKDVPERMAVLWVERLEKLLDMPLPFHKVGIAHLVCEMIGYEAKGNYLKALKLLREEDMRRLFTKAAELGCGIELNQYDMDVPDDALEEVLRMFRIAKECGCKFYIGSDAHHPDHFARTKLVFEKIVDLLELKESDKFHIGR